MSYRTASYGLAPGLTASDHLRTCEKCKRVGANPDLWGASNLHFNSLPEGCDALKCEHYFTRERKLNIRCLVLSPLFSALFSSSLHYSPVVKRGFGRPSLFVGQSLSFLLFTILCNVSNSGLRKNRPFCGNIVKNHFASVSMHLVRDLYIFLL